MDRLNFKQLEKLYLSDEKSSVINYLDDSEKKDLEYKGSDDDSFDIHNLDSKFDDFKYTGIEYDDEDWANSQLYKFNLIYFKKNNLFIKHQIIY